QVTVKRRKGNARADDPQIDRDTACLAKEFLRSFHQQATQAGALARRIHGEEPDVPAIALQLDIDTAGEAGGILRDHEFPFFDTCEHALPTDTIAIENLPLNKEGGVNQAS